MFKLGFSTKQTDESRSCVLCIQTNIVIKKMSKKKGAERLSQSNYVNSRNPKNHRIVMKREKIKIKKFCLSLFMQITSYSLFEISNRLWRKTSLGVSEILFLFELKILSLELG